MGVVLLPQNATPKAAQRATKAVPASSSPQPSYTHDRTVTAAAPFDSGLPAIQDVLPDVMSAVGNRV